MIRPPKSASHRVAMNTGILYAKTGITMFISLYTIRLIINSLGASDFGIFGIVATAIGLLGFLGSAMAASTQRFMSYSQGDGDREKQRIIFNVSIILHFLIAMVLCVALLIAGYFFFNGTLNIPSDRVFAARVIYYFMIASFLFTVISVPYEAVLNAHENMLYYAIVGIVESLLRLTVAFIVVSSAADKLIVYGALMAGISFIVLSIMRIYCHRNYDECLLKPKVYFNSKMMKEMTIFAGWSFLGNISQTIANSGQAIVINKFFGTVINASQSLAGQINGQLSVLTASLMKALNPVIVKSEGAGNRKLMIDATMMGCKLSFFLLAIVSIPALIEMPYILNIWLKADSVPEYAVAFCRLQLIRSLIEQLFGAVASSIVAHGNIKFYEIVASIFCYFPLVATIILFMTGCEPSYMYVAYIVYTVFASGIIIYFAWNNYRFPVSLFLKRTVLRSICTFVITFFIASIFIFFFDEGLIRLLLVVATGIVMFIFFFWFVGLDKEERAQAVHSLTPLISKVFSKKFL